jgi:hypothetical protein
MFSETRYAMNGDLCIGYRASAKGERDIVIGSGLEFEDRGAHQLKGVPGEWRLFAVASA